MPILNYTTEIAAEKSIGEIHAMLTRAKALAVMFENTDHGEVAAISFRIKTIHGVMTFRLPANVQQVYQALVREKLPPRLKTRAQAARVAWRITKDWLEAQLALVSIQMVDLEQVFLPYMQHQDGGATVYERLKEGEFKGLVLALPAGPA